MKRKRGLNSYKAVCPVTKKVKATDLDKETAAEYAKLGYEIYRAFSYNGEIKYHKVKKRGTKEKNGKPNIYE